MQFFGIPVRFSVFSLFLAFLFGSVGWDIAYQYELFARLLFAGVAVILLFLSILVHEAAHVGVAARYGIGCNGIVMHMFGGVSLLESVGKYPGQVFWIAVVGPLTSFLIAVGLAVATIVAVASAFIPFESALVVLLSYFAQLNIVLGIFNLLPVFPLDGGRIVHSVLWAVTRDEARGRRGAAITGRIALVALALLALYAMLQGILSLFSILWLGMIGFLLWSAQEAELRP